MDNHKYKHIGIVQRSGNSIQKVLPVVNKDNAEFQDKTLLERLKEVEELNDNLSILLEQSEKKLADIVETNAKFIRVIAHDLRSPFSSIIGILEILKEKLHNYDIKEIEHFIDIVFESANKTLNLLDNLLIWTVLQNKENGFNPVKISLLELVQMEFENVGSQVNQKSISLRNDVHEGLCISADLQMVRTILRNLVNNAIKYTNIGGEISISAKEVGSFIEITVQDNGIGISPETQTHLFQSHGFQITEGTNHEQGSGLGLMLCKEFVSNHGGEMRIVSDGKKGSKFIFTMPHYI